jgi:hypothetical protein
MVWIIEVTGVDGDRSRSFGAIRTMNQQHLKLVGQCQVLIVSFVSRTADNTDDLISE